MVDPNSRTCGENNWMVLRSHSSMVDPNRKQKTLNNSGLNKKKIHILRQTLGFVLYKIISWIMGVSYNITR